MLMDLLLCFFLILMDQFSKYYAFLYLAEHQSLEIIPNFFYLSKVRNEGAAWGLFAGQMWLFYLVTVIGIFLIVDLYRETPQENRWIRTALIMILSGAIGNLIDRIYFRYVRDFLDFKIFSYDFPVFNVADSILVIGVMMIILYLLVIPEGDRDVIF